MNKLYQVFISSTYLDLIKERKTVMDTLIKTNCIPRGMELFPARNSKLLDTIEAVINECDYYIIIIGGRYGSVDIEHRLSYTELEYDIALKTGIPILAFLVEKSGKNQRKNAKLKKFIEKIQRNNSPLLCVDKEDLAIKISYSITDAIKTHPRPGLIKGFSFSNVDTRKLNDIEEFYERNNARLLYCIDQGIYDEYISRNINVTPCVNDECFQVRSSWKFKCVSLHGFTPQFSFNHNSAFKEFLANFNLITYRVNGKDLLQNARMKTKSKYNKETNRYFVLFQDSLPIDDENTAEVECVYEFKVSLPEYNSYSSYMYPAKSRDVKVTIEGKDSGGWVLKANSFASFRNLGNNLNSLWSNRDNYVECKSDNSYNLNIKEWTLPGTGFSFTISKREHTTQCWKPKF